MLNQEIVDKLKQRYPDIHPLLFNRSIERARSDADLFDILETMPSEYPIVWSEDEHRWKHTRDVFQKEGMKE